jgi:hypothetical protein
MKRTSIGMVGSMAVIAAGGSLLALADGKPPASAWADPLIEAEGIMEMGSVEEAEGEPAMDVGDALDAYQLGPGGDAATYDISPCGGNGEVDLDDILAVLDAFAGLPACRWENCMWVPN